MTEGRLTWGPRRVPAATWAGLASAAMCLPLYVLTLLPGVGFWDTAEFQAVGPVLGIAHPTGFPTYTLLLWLASVVLQPFGDPALRANLLSALLVAGASGIVATLVSVISGRALVGLAAGFALGIAPIAWSLALGADPHALHIALVAVLLALLVGWQRRQAAGADADRWLLTASLVFGIALGNHALTLLLAPGIALYLLAVAPRLFVERRRLVGACAAVIAATTVAIYLYLPIRASMNPPLNYADPQSWDGFRYVVFAEQFRGSLTTLPPLPDMIGQVILTTLIQLGPLALLVPVGVWVAAQRHRPLLLLLAAWWLVGWLFALGYVNADIGRYYLVPLAATAVVAGIGAGAVIDFAARMWVGPGGAALSRPAFVLAAILLIVPTSVAIPGRFGELDQSHDTAARLWLNTALPQLAPNAVVISWWSYSTTLWYAQFVDGERRDVYVVDDRTMIDQHLGEAPDVIERYLGSRPVYVIRLDDDLYALEQTYQLTPMIGPEWADGIVYRVDGRWPGGD